MKTKILSLLALSGLLFFSQCDEPIDALDVENLLIDANVTSASLQVMEADGQQTVTIAFGEAIPANITIDVAVSGTATYGEDYTTSLDQTSEGYSFSVVAGESQASFSFTPIDDKDIEDLETATFGVSVEDERINLGTSEVTMTIESDDVNKILEWLSNSAKLTSFYLPANCRTSSYISIEYDEDNLPIGFSVDSNYGEKGRTDGRPPFDADFTFEYDDESFWVTGLNNGPQRGSGDVEEPWVMMTGTVTDDGMLSEVTTYEYSDETDYYETLIEYDSENRISTMTSSFVAGSYYSDDYDYLDEGDIVYQDILTFTYSGSSVNISVQNFQDEDYYDDRTDGLIEVESDYDVDFSNVTINDKNNPLNGFGSIVMMLGSINSPI